MASPASSANARATRSAQRATTYHLDNFELGPPPGPLRPVLTSPRSIAICQKFGIEPETLLPRTMESFAQGNVPRKIIERRYEHYESKRQQRLQFLREERRNMAESPSPVPSTSDGRSPNRYTDPSVPGSTPRARAIAKSPARANALRSKEIQQRNLELLSAQRQARAEELEKSLSAQIDTALTQKQTVLETQQIRSLQHWNQVQTTNEKYHIETEMKRNEKSQTVGAKNEKRLSAAEKAEIEREKKALLLRQENRHRETWARTRAEEIEFKEQLKHRSINEKISSEIENADSRHEELMNQRRVAGERHDQAIAEAHEKASAHEEKRRNWYSARAQSKWTSHDKLWELKTQAQSDIRERRAMQHAQYLESVKEREHSLRESARRSKNEKLSAVNQEFSARQQARAEDALWETEIKHEKVTDHVEEVQRVRKAHEYERQSRFQSIVAKTEEKHKKAVFGE